MLLLPYTSPLQRDFSAGAFRDKTRTFAARIDALCESGFTAGTGGMAPWRFSLACARQPAVAWRPKLYVCVGPRDYWRCVEALAGAFDAKRQPWKFYRGPRPDRPDKICFYFDSPRELAAALPRVRRLLRGMETRRLSHAASTAELGLERPGAGGLYVGCDPILLKNTSWRIYRCLCAAWAKKNAAYLASLPGGAERWLRRMNLSLRHQGPADPAPPASDHAYVRRYWRMIRPAR